MLGMKEAQKIFKATVHKYVRQLTLVLQNKLRGHAHF